MVKSFHGMVKMFAALGVTKQRWNFIRYVRIILQPKFCFPCLPNSSRAVSVPNYILNKIKHNILLKTYLFININQLEALNFIISLFQASTCFEHMCSKHVEA